MCLIAIDRFACLWFALSENHLGSWPSPMNWWCSNEFHELWINELWQWISCLSYAQCKEVIPLSWNSSPPVWIYWITPMCYERGTKPPASFSIHEFALATGSEGDIWSLYMKDQVPGKKHCLCMCVFVCPKNISV